MLENGAGEEMIVLNDYFYQNNHIYDDRLRFRDRERGWGKRAKDR